MWYFFLLLGALPPSTSPEGEEEKATVSALDRYSKFLKFNRDVDRKHFIVFCYNYISVGQKVILEIFKIEFFVVRSVYV